MTYWLLYAVDFHHKIQIVDICLNKETRLYLVMGLCFTAYRLVLFTS